MMRVRELEFRVLPPPPSPKRELVELDLFGKLEESNYDNSGVDISLSLRPPDGHVKSCSACRGTQTPLWRSGPNGPKTLCNACGIRHRKKVDKPNTNLALGPSTSPTGNGPGATERTEADRLRQ